ncbi:hypothetical protein F8S13_05520 [Chloroflexia bacterium SDU3-3]|nr:hypothetical protein F8S13_05520 [Chloroflexia bacterium SDU3-3]
MIALDQPTARHCRRCDTRLPNGAQFCVVCGSAYAATEPQQAAAEPQRQTAAAVACPTCGAANPTSAGFCVSCGRGMHIPPAAPGYGYTPAMVNNTNIYVTNAITPQQPLIIRALWFLFIGLWLGPLWIVAGWLLNLTIIGMPLGLWMLNHTGTVMTLQQRSPRVPAGSTLGLLARAIYFVLIGWWASLVWLALAWAMAASVIGLPVAFLMFDRVGTVTTMDEI